MKQIMFTISGVPSLDDFLGDRLVSRSAPYCVHSQADRPLASSIVDPSGQAADAAGTPLGADTGMSALVAAQNRHEDAAFATGGSGAFSTSGITTGRAWNRAPKFGPFDHSQARRCAT